MENQTLPAKSNIIFGSMGSTFMLIDGSVFACGNNQYGQLGTGDQIYRSKPIDITPSIDGKTVKIKNVTTSGDTTFLITTDNQIFASGLNESGQLGLDNNQPCLSPNKIKGEFTQITTSGITTFFLDKNGQVYACGNNQYGQLGILTDAKEIFTPTKIEAFSDIKIKKIVASRYKTFFIDENDQVYGCGNNDNHYLGLSELKSTPTPLKILPGVKVKEISVSNQSTFFIDENGQTYGCGNNDNGRVGLYPWGKIFTPQKILPKLKIKQVIAGESSTFLLSEKGEVYGCGDNHSYQLCRAPGKVTITIRKPKKLPVENVEHVIINKTGSSVLFLTKPGETFAVGSNENGELGINDITVYSDHPQRIKTETKVHQALFNTWKWGAWGSTSLIFIGTDGKFYLSGNDNYNFVPQIDHTRIPVAFSSFDALRFIKNKYLEKFSAISSFATNIKEAYQEKEMIGAIGALLPSENLEDFEIFLRCLNEKVGGMHDDPKEVLNNIEGVKLVIIDMIQHNPSILIDEKAIKAIKEKVIFAPVLKKMQEIAKLDNTSGKNVTKLLNCDDPKELALLLKDKNFWDFTIDRECEKETEKENIKQRLDALRKIFSSEMMAQFYEFAKSLPPQLANPDISDISNIPVPDPQDLRNKIVISHEVVKAFIKESAAVMLFAQKNPEYKNLISTLIKRFSAEIKVLFDPKEYMLSIKKIFEMNKILANICEEAKNEFEIIEQLGKEKYLPKIDSYITSSLLEILDDLLDFSIEQKNRQLTEDLIKNVIHILQKGIINEPAIISIKNLLKKTIDNKNDKLINEFLEKLGEKNYLAEKKPRIAGSILDILNNLLDLPIGQKNRQLTKNLIKNATLFIKKETINEQSIEKAKKLIIKTLEDSELIGESLEYALCVLQNSEITYDNKLFLYTKTLYDLFQSKDIKLLGKINASVKQLLSNIEYFDTSQKNYFLKLCDIAIQHQNDGLKNILLDRLNTIADTSDFAYLWAEIYKKRDFDNQQKLSEIFNDHVNILSSKLESAKPESSFLVNHSDEIINLQKIATLTNNDEAKKRLVRAFNNVKTKPIHIEISAWIKYETKIYNIVEKFKDEQLKNKLFEEQTKMVKNFVFSKIPTYGYEEYPDQMIDFINDDFIQLCKFAFEIKNQKLLNRIIKFSTNFMPRIYDSIKGKPAFFYDKYRDMDTPGSSQLYPYGKPWRKSYITFFLNQLKDASKLKLKDEIEITKMFANYICDQVNNLYFTHECCKLAKKNNNKAIEELFLNRLQKRLKNPLTKIKLFFGIFFPKLKKIKKFVKDELPIKKPGKPKKIIGTPKVITNELGKPTKKNRTPKPTKKPDNKPTGPLPTKKSRKIVQKPTKPEGPKPTL